MISIEAELLFVVAVLALLMLISVIRILLGPTIPDRVVALDATSTFAMSAMVLVGAAFREIIYIDVAIIYGMLSFVSTLFIANYLEARK